GVSLAVLLHGGGPQGLVPGALNPLKAFSAVPGGSVGIALFFCFWSWVGYETCAVYGEESTDPTRIVPRSVLIAVLAVGALYVFVSWMAVAGNGPARAVHLSRTDALQLFFGITRRFVGVWAFKLFEILIVTGSFACALAFHNTAARYLYALGREAPGARVRRGLGSTHRRHQSPHVASLVQSAVTLGIVAAFFAFSSGGAGPVEYVDLYGLMAILGTALVLICQTLCSLSVVAYFHVRHEHPETASWWRTLVAPLVGAAAMAYVVYLLFANLSFAAGAAASSPVFAATPWIVLAVAALGLVGAEVLRRTDPARHARIGRTVLDTTAAAPGARRTADASPGEVPAAVPGASTG
ncbi:MAG TPA: APC family permease, partial [Acidimicrobiales bacterium]|nr:APC family permease [Acidimicrobiales bacterium]